MGGEDDDLKFRLDAKKIPIIRDVFFERFKTNLIFDDDLFGKRDKNLDNKKLKDMNRKKYFSNHNKVMDDGISNCDYKILNKKKYKNKNIQRILVDI